MRDARQEHRAKGIGHRAKCREHGAEGQWHREWEGLRIEATEVGSEIAEVGNRGKLRSREVGKLWIEAKRRIRNPISFCL